MSPENGQASGVVKVRLSGAAADIELIAQMIGDVVIERSAPIPGG